MRGLTLATEPFVVFGANLGCVLKKLYHFLLYFYKYGFERGIAAACRDEALGTAGTA